MKPKDMPKGANKDTNSWWTLEGDDAAEAVGSTISLLQSVQGARQKQMVISARLYGNLSSYGPWGMNTSSYGTTIPGFSDRVTYNIVETCTDTITSKIAKNKPQPYYLTSGGDFKNRRKAKKLTKLMEGIFYSNNAYDLGITAFRDAVVWGDGFIHVYVEDQDGEGKVCMERVLPSELVIDEIEALYGNPRQMHRIKLVDRHVLKEMFPDKAQIIDDAAETLIQANTASAGHVSSLVTIRESWRLPSRPGAGDGRYLLSLDNNCLIEPQPWEFDFFPFARMQWLPRLYGYWSQGLAEILQAIQLEINRLLVVIQRNQARQGAYKVLLENGSKIPDQHINNMEAAIIHYTGTKPEYITPPMVQPEVYAHLQTLIKLAYEQAGISQLSATSQKPAGLNSGEAQRVYMDIESDRFTVIGRRYEGMYLEMSRIALALMGASDSKYVVKVPGKKEINKVSWKDAKLDSDEYVIKCYPISALPQEPAGRLQTIQEYAQAGYLTPRQARQLLDFPDLEQLESLQNAAEEYLTSILDKIVDDGEYTPPDPFDDLNLGKELALEYIQQGKIDNVPDDRMQMFRTFIAQIDDLIKAATPPPAPIPPMGAPQAPPVPPVPSPLVPNVPAQ